MVIDGGAPITVDTSGTIRQFAQRIYQSPALAAGPHTVVVTKATGASISVDAVRVTTSG